MKKYTITVEGSGPYEIVEKLKEIEQAILLGQEEAYTMDDNNIVFTSSGQYDA